MNNWEFRVKSPQREPLGISAGWERFHPVLRLLNPVPACVGFLLLLSFAVTLEASQENVLITEFMAINDHTLTNQEGVYPDWIEIYNASANAVNLGGWRLTDDPANLTKWQFPSISLPGYCYLVVFASGTSQTNPALPLSTSFKLSGGGEYLGLIKPDGTVAWEYAPHFPPQTADISYGLGMMSTTYPLVSVGDAGQFFVPSEDIGTGWLLPEFDDSGWFSFWTPLGYDTSTNYQDILQTDVGWAMQGFNASAYLRMPFYVDDPSVLKDLRLRMRYDDGFVAYLNGQEVARRNAPGLLSWNSAATAPHGLPFPENPTVQNFDVPGANYSLQTNSISGSYFPTILPADSGSTGRFLRLANNSVSNLNTIVFDRTATGAVTTVVATFDFRMTPVSSRADGMAFALLPTSLYGTNGPPTGPFSGISEEPNLTGAIGVGFDIYQNSYDPNANHVSVHYNGVLLSNPPAVPPFDLANGYFHRAEITIRFADAGALVTVRVTPNINRSPGPTSTLFSDFLIAGVSAYEGRAAFGARTGGANALEDLDNVNVRFVPSQTLAPEEFNLTSFLGSLRAGANVLAIQGLNLAADDADFVLGPELMAAEVTVSTDVQGFFATPTPGAPNLGGAPALAPAPVFLAPGGIFTNGFDVEIAIDSVTAEVHYTLDGTEPTASSALYSGPIFIANSTTLRARGFAPGLLPSAIVSQTYTLLENNVVNFTSNLPLIILDTFGRSIVEEDKIPATMTLIEPYHGRSSMLRPPAAQLRTGIEIRGQSSTMFPKKSYGFETRDEADQDLHVPLFGLPANSDWVLYAPYTDKTFMNDFLAYELHEKMGHYAVRRRFVEVFVDSSGRGLNYADYAGIYVLLEKIKIGPDRVNIAQLKPGDSAEPDITGGYIFKKDKDSPGDVNFTTLTGQVLKYDDPKGENLTAAQRTWLLNYINKFERALYAANWTNATGTNHYSYYIDVDSFVDQHWIVEYTKNIDGYRLSDFFHKDRSGKIFMDPIWDWNLSFGNANYNQGWETNGWYYAQNGTPAEDNPNDPIEDDEHIWLRQLVGLPSGSPPGDPDFQQKIADRWSVLRTNILATSNVLARVDEIAALLNEAQARDFQRWPRLGTPIWPNPDDYALITTYSGTVDWMKRWIAGRFSWIDQQYPMAPPQFNHPGGLIVPGFYLIISATNPVYFTLDGSDPRAPGGALSSSALLYTGPATLTSNVLAFARARTSGGAWGPPAMVSLYTKLPSLIVSEIMYHPQDPPPGSPYTAEDFEFVELKNTGTTSINLRNARLSGGISFVFSNQVLGAGQSLVLARNRAAFQARYGSAISVAGEFSGHLADSGDHLVLTGALGEPILDFSFKDDWYPITDGPGFSLVAANLSPPPGGWETKGAWRPSSAANGSPGQNDPLSSGFAAVLINEALTHADAPAVGTVELYNASGTNADISGWFLTDDFNVPKKYRIPHRVIPGGSFVLFDENAFNLSGGEGVLLPFTCHSEGGEIYLFSGDANTNLTGYVHGFAYAAQRTGVTFGRYRTSTGEEHFVAQNVPTLGAVNSGPLIGQVVLSEIMYHPPDVLIGGSFYDNTEDEYVQLQNVSGTDVPLYDPDNPANTWQLDGAVRYSFPQGSVIPEGGYLLVVSFDPQANPDQLASFQDNYGLGLDIPVVGPYSGKLSNAGDSLELNRPDSPGPDGEVPYVLVERVRYTDDAPWPLAADGLGFSLQRVNPAAYGDDPANWTAGSPSPGHAFLPGDPPAILKQPFSQTVPASTNVTLSVTAPDSGLRYQWRFQGQNIAGATTPILALTNVQPADSGEYRVLVLNSSNSILSNPALLSVVPTLRIAAPPQTRSVRLSSMTNVLATNISFSVFTLGGAPPLRYQWRFNGSDVPGATNDTYLVNTISTASQGTVQVSVSDQFTSVLSAPATLNVLVAPVVTRPLPITMTALQGETVTFTVSASGSPLPFTFQWRRFALVLTNIMLNSTNCSFSLYNVQPGDSSTYRAVITNLASPTNILPANTACTLTVLADSNGNHIADEWEARYGFALNDSTVAGADPDHDGMSNLQEYLAGTDPMNALSALRLDSITIGGVCAVRFGAVSNKSYSLQYKNALGDLNWLKLSDVSSRASNWNAVVTDSATNRSRYYRLVTPSQP